MMKKQQVIRKQKQWIKNYIKKMKKLKKKK